MYVDQRLKPLIDMEGPMWRWREDNPITASFSPDSPEEFAKAGRIRDLLVSGLALKVQVEQFGSDTGALEISTGNSSQRLDRDAPGPRVLSWSPQGNPEAFITMYPVAPLPPPAPTTADGKAAQTGADGKPAAAGSPAPAAAPPVPPARIDAEGPWAFFRLMDKADKQNSGPQKILATFRSGSHWATVSFELPSTSSPFTRGGMWTFRCPTAL